MKRKLFHSFLCLSIIGIVIIGGICFKNSYKKVYADELPIQNSITLKQKANIDIKEIPNNYLAATNASNSSFISKKQAIDAANIYCGDLYKTTTIKAQQNLLSDDTLSVELIDKQAVEANPILKNKNKISDIPVWLISYEGTNIKRHNVTLNEQVVVVDAITGKVLYSFRYR